MRRHLSQRLVARKPSPIPINTHCAGLLLRYASPMGGRLERYFIPAVIGFAPLLLFLLNWDAERMGSVARMLREYTFPVFVAELFTIVIAFREGMLASWK